MTDEERRAKKAAYMRKYRKEHPERHTAPEYREARRAASRRYRGRHPERLLERQRKYAKENPEIKKEQMRRYRERNSDAIKERERGRYQQLSPEEKLARSLKIQCGQYGITVADYRLMEHCQQGRCAVCREVGEGRRLDIDHDHTTGSVRGLLCRRCNLAVGFWERGGPKLIEQLICYIRRTSGPEEKTDA